MLTTARENALHLGSSPAYPIAGSDHEISSVWPVDPSIMARYAAIESGWLELRTSYLCWE